MTINCYFMVNAAIWLFECCFTFLPLPADYLFSLRIAHSEDRFEAFGDHGTARFVSPRINFSSFSRFGINWSADVEAP